MQSRICQVLYFPFIAMLSAVNWDLQVQVVLGDGRCSWPCPHTPKGVCLWWLKKCNHKVQCDWSVIKHVKARLCFSEGSYLFSSVFLLFYDLVDNCCVNLTCIHTTEAAVWAVECLLQELTWPWSVWCRFASYWYSIENLNSTDECNHAASRNACQW